MTIDITSETEGYEPDDIAGLFAAFGDALDDELASAAEDIGARIEGAAKRNIQDQNAVDRGQLLNQIEFRTETIGERVIRVMVGTNAPHGAVIEEGADPFYPPVDPLKGWASRVLGDESLAWAVQQSISETGFDPRPYLEPAFNEHEDWAIDRVRTAVINARDEVFD